MGRYIKKGRKSSLHKFNKLYTVNPKNGCWEWNAPSKKTGYGQFKTNDGKHHTAHRASYVLFIGEVDDRFDFICHKCDNRRCVNPFHLFKGSPKDNTQDMIDKGRRKTTPRSPHPSRASYKRGCRCDDCVRITRDYNNINRAENAEQRRQYDKDRYPKRKAKRLLKKEEAKNAA